MHVCICMSIYIHVYVYICVCACVCICVSVYLCILNRGVGSNKFIFLPTSFCTWKISGRIYYGTTVFVAFYMFEIKPSVNQSINCHHCH